MITRKRINRISERQKERLKEYAAVRKDYLAGLAGSWCPVALKIEGKRRKITEIHHRRGRIGSLLWDVRYFMGVSAWGHRFIHNHPGEAREYGWLCELGLWGKEDKQPTERTS